MAAPQLKNDLKIEINGRLVSLPYVSMTTQVMKSFGANVEVQNQDSLPTSFLIRG